MLKDLFVKHLVDKVPKGWKTTRQWAKEENAAIGQTSMYLRKGMAIGVVETQKFKILVGDVVRPIPHYRVKQA